MDYSEARTLKDFLYLYNKISEDCFKKCVFNMTRRTLDDEEGSCISTCVQKHVKVNHKTMEFFAEINPIFQQKKMEEHQQELQKLQQQQQATATSAVADTTTESSS
ncbi:Mitochondrial import inner membrane translocase subunit Tim10 B [Orchesella cincta]|uniref:Mitochondrial import inner membrane translocase subunit n=1 Tax=Orchesella cincta TaxID=48709 RepID=A0A1D2MGH9_ORCCI|nr:Mitochondrial import inner membrane translocase subunit Tim10 B [Orchesella cincta]